MERHEVLAGLKALRLHGMASALEEAVSTGIKRGRSPWEVLAELVSAESAERKVRSIRYQLATAKFPLATAARISTNWRSPPATRARRRRTCASGAGKSH